MDLFTVVILALALTFLGFKTKVRIFNLASAIVFIYLVFNSGDPILMLAFIAMAIYQFYATFFGHE